MYPIKQSTAITIPFFAHDANGDGVTGMADGGFTKRISKNGGAFAAMTVTITELENGWYSFPLSTSHSDTLGILSISFSNASCKRVNLQFRVSARINDDYAYPATSGRSIQVETDGMVHADLKEWLGTAPLALSSQRVQTLVGAMAANVLTATAIDTDAITATKIAAGAITSSEAPNLDVAISTRAAASVLGTLADAAADGDPTAVDTVMQYIKQLVNILVGTTGIVTFPAEAAPANNVSLAEVIRAIYNDVTGLNGDAMRGTDNAALASVATEARLAELDAANLPADIDTLLSRLGTPSNLGGGATVAFNLSDMAGVTFAAGTDSQEAIANAIAALNNLSAAQVNTEVDTALADARLDELASATAGGVAPTVGSLLDLIMNKDGGQTFSQAADSLEAIRDRGDAAWTTGGGGANPILLKNTTIATLASQTEFTLTDGSTDNDAYNNMLIIVTDSGDTDQKAIGIINDYTGATRTVFLREDPAIFTMAIGDTVDVIAISKDIADILVDTGTTIPGLIAALNDIAVTDILADSVAFNGANIDASISSRATAASIAALNDIAVTDILSDSVPFLGASIAAILSDTDITIPALIAALNNFDPTTDPVIVGTMNPNVINAASIAANALTDAKFAADAFDGMFVRDLDQVEVGAPVHSFVTAALKAVSRVRDNGGTLEIYRTNGVTIHASQTITVDAANDPIDELGVAT